MQAYGKPAIAVFNHRNDRWRHPANERDPESRRALSDTVRQHVDNINGELARIGLRGAPVVAMHSHRALMARAQAALRRAVAEDLQGNLDRYGATYLDTWSNLRVLEDLIANCLVVGGTDLRLAALREGCPHGAAGVVGRDADLRRRRARARRGQRALGRADARGARLPGQEGAQAAPAGGAESDLLTALERRRGVPFDAPVTGRLAAHGRHLLRSTWARPARRALRRAEDAVIDAFESKKTLGQEVRAARLRPGRGGRRPGGRREPGRHVPDDAAAA